MIDYPVDPAFREITVSSKDPTVIHRAQNGRRIARKVDGHIWTLTLTYPPMKRSTFAPVLGAIAAARGAYDTFTVIAPNLRTPEGSQTADTAVAANAGAGSTSVDISGAGAGATFYAGDIMKLSNSSKVYMLTASETADGGGLATVSFMPPLVEACTTADTMKHSEVFFTVGMTADVQEFKTSVSGYIKYELDVEEVFQ